MNIFVLFTILAKNLFLFSWLWSDWCSFLVANIGFNFKFSTVFRFYKVVEMKKTFTPRTFESVLFSH